MASSVSLSFKACAAFAAASVALASAFKVAICVVTSFAFLNLAVSKSINLAFKLASSSKSSLVELAWAFSATFASNLNCAAAISLLVISSS